MAGSVKLPAFCYTFFMEVIKVTNLQKHYKNTQALRGVSFSVNRGEVFGILGPNGAGKTTTLEIIEGLKKQTSGNVQVLGLDNLKDSQTIKKKIGVQLQSSDYLAALTLVEQIKLFASIYGSRKDPLELLTFVDLEDKAGEVVANLSGGQKQRFTLATSLVNDPEIVFLDEPTTGLDPRARRNVWQLVRNINAKGITVVMTTHYMEEAEFLCGRVAIMDRGVILTINNPKTLINDLSHTIQVSFLTTQKLDESIWQPLGGVIEKVYNDFPKVILEIKSLDNVKEIIDILHSKDVEFSGFTVKTATLEDVYLDLTGKEYETE